jgi:hypothetical protein
MVIYAAPNIATNPFISKALGKDGLEAGLNKLVIPVHPVIDDHPARLYI